MTSSSEFPFYNAGTDESDTKVIWAGFDDSKLVIASVDDGKFSKSRVVGPKIAKELEKQRDVLATAVKW